MMVKGGDYIGLATSGGNFAIASEANGSTTQDFSGHLQDMNGSVIKPTATEANVELLVQVDLVPPSVTPTPVTTGEAPKKPKEEKKKKAPCKCMKFTIKLDPTLLNKKKLRSDKHSFGVGFTWRMTCSEGAGGCAGTVTFSPPKILAGTLPKPKNGLRLNLKVMKFKCNTACKTSTQGRFEVKMSSRDQLNKLFGRTLAFSVHLFCPLGPFSSTTRVKVFVDQKGALHARR
jgi:hypothetical protein